LTSFAIGAKLRQERIGRGLSIDAISKETRIPSRYLEAIENDDFSDLPGLIFARNFVRQFALALKLDPDPLLMELPRQDEATVQLPNPPQHKRWSFERDRRIRSLLSSTIWILVLAGAGTLGYLHYNRSGQFAPQQVEAASAPISNTPATAPVPGTANLKPVDQVPAEQPVTEPAPLVTSAVENSGSATAPVNVVVTAHAPAWIQITADGKSAFTGTLQTDETKHISAAELVKLLTGNAGALTISLNGKTLDSLGPVGQVRSVSLTAAGPALLKAPPPPAPDPL
jgi:cytoskeletal protein RodZ